MAWYIWLGLAVAAYGLLAVVSLGLLPPLPADDDDDNDPTLLGKDRFLP
jgi:hypothetical protein